MVLLTVLKKVRERERQMRVLVLGLDNAGKSAIMRRLRNEPLDGLAPTVGFDIETFQLDRYTLTLLDIGGQRAIRAYWRSYFEQTDGVIWVVDAADSDERMHLCTQTLAELLGEERLMGASLLVLANKQDLPAARPAASVSSALRLAELAARRHWHVEPCSAYAPASGEAVDGQVAGDGLLRGLQWLVDDIASRLYVD